MLTKYLFPSTAIETISQTRFRYIDNSIKQAAREQRGHGTRTKVSAQTKMPKKWSDFLRVSQNKQELFSFLTKAITNMETAEEKILCATSGK